MAYVYPDEDDDDRVEVAAFEYSGNGLRTKAIEGNIVTKYYYDGLNVLFEKDASDQTKRSYIRKFDFPGGIGGLIAMKRYKLKEKDGNNANGKMYYYHYDALGSVVKLTDEKGKFRAGYNYDAFGNNLKRGKTGNSYRFSRKRWKRHLKKGKTGNPYRFSSKEWEAHAGLYYFGARYYDPRIGRFLQTDPIRYTAGINLYAYVGNNPINFIDPFGLYREKKDKWWRWGQENWLWQIIYGQNEVIPMPGERWENYHQRFVQDFGKQMVISDFIGAWGFKSLITTSGMYGVTKGGAIVTSRVAQRTLTTLGGKGFLYVRGLPQAMYLRQASSGFMTAGKISGVITVGATAYSGGLRLREWIYWKITTSVYNK